MTSSWGPPPCGWPDFSKKDEVGDFGSQARTQVVVTQEQLDEIKARVIMRVVPGLTSSEQAKTPRKWFVVNCLDCDEASRPMTIPFGSADERDKWTEGHRSTGHKHFLVRDEPRDD